MSGKSQFVVQVLGDQPRKDFSCGVEVLDRYFVQQARQDLRRKVAVPYLLVDTETGAVAGYYTLSAGSIVGDSLSDEIRRKLPRYEAFPIALIGRLAVDTSYQGRRLGGILLLDALLRCAQLSEEIAVLAVVVHAKGDDARAFYESFEFQRFQDNDYHLYLPIARIRSLCR